MNWSDFMQNAFSSYHVSYCKPEVLLLPIIDLNPSDNNCMYSTLSYIQDYAKLSNILTPCVTLNSLRYVKFLEMVSASKVVDPHKLPPTERASHFHSL